jgi:hypothetical protein
MVKSEKVSESSSESWPRRFGFWLLKCQCLGCRLVDLGISPVTVLPVLAMIAMWGSLIVVLIIVVFILIPLMTVLVVLVMSIGIMLAVVVVVIVVVIVVLAFAPLALYSCEK